MTIRFKHDLIVVAIPVYNEERFIADTISSVKAQQFGDFLALICDNASTDRTEEICRREITGDKRFRYVRHSENRGAAWNFNFALDATDSRYFMWLGGHDKIAPEFLLRHIHALEERPECSLSYSPTQWIDACGDPLEITDASNLAAIQGSPRTRYLTSARRLNECTAINNVLRRSSLGSARFENVLGCDMVMLSELLFHGPAHLESRPMYLRREVGKVGKNYMENLTGRQNLERDSDATVRLYLRSYDKVMGRLPGRWLAHARLRFLLQQNIRRRFTWAWVRARVRRLLGRG